jgi:hypothetical protein
MMLVHRRTFAGGAPRRRQALLRTIERAASIASRVRPVLVPALASLRQYSIARRAALSAASSSSPEWRSATFSYFPAQN